MRFAVILLSFVLVMCYSVEAHWKPEYAQNSQDLQNWFRGLHSDNSGSVGCCALADGINPNDDDVVWDTSGGHYRVRVEGNWYDVPDSAVINEPNKYGRTVVWYSIERGIDGNISKLFIRCFMPGSLI